MSVRGTVLVAALACAVPLVVAAPGHSAPAAGGCADGGVMTGRMIPGTGSAGQSIQREVTLRDCLSPFLPGIRGGQFSVTIPWNATTVPTAARFTWSDGSISTATGFGNGVWRITAGPATGHAIQLDVADTWNGWYLSSADVTVTGAQFVS
ncbi:hypothetical protein [Nocardia macrotermitis]|uniref:Uncharacterized protein n=1 Tax=Nocardia macrotermitis TaxID=2585198 RepID=A0A7K0CVV1_9NOCA|nr:hypothetical protein [Nocardia macrotermitis]MQY17112.1 hypothetical protein [Nocardia macrotermitis]